MSNIFRRFRDARGAMWDVWVVVPHHVERRFQSPATPPDGVERRQRAESRVNLGRRMANGWLAFSSGMERRRLAPIPKDWHQLEDAELASLCARATPVTRASHS
jgi:hypothetical protein